MRLPVALRAEAKVEMDEAFDWYEGQKPGLGEDFARKVENVFDRIAAMPKIHGVVFEDVRKAVVKKFPYCVYYREEVDQVVVLAVFHSKRDPKIWQARI